MGARQEDSLRTLQPRPEGDSRNGARVGRIAATHQIKYIAGEKMRREFMTGIFKRKATVAAGVLGFISLMVIVLVQAQPSSGHSDNLDGGCDAVGCHPSTTTAFLTITNLPTSTYTPNQAYTITISIDDTNGATGRNAFNFIVTAGTLSTTDPNVEVLAGNLQAHTLTDSVSSWTVVWTAPASGSAVIDTWAVFGGGSKATSPWNHNQRTLNSSAIPEFPTILIPAVGIVGSILVISVIRKRKPQ